MIEKIGAFFDKFNMKFSLPARIVCGCIVVVIILAAVLGSVLPQEKEKTEPEDTNVYLNEEVCFAGDIYIKVTSISVTKIEENINKIDEDGDELSSYTLNLTINIEQRTEKRKRNTEIKPSLFTLKNVNLKSKSKMKVFFETMANASLQAAASIAINGDINILEETINFAGDYATEVSNSVVTEEKFKPIKLDDNEFEAFKPKQIGEPREIKISFPIKEEYLESENTIVLTIDSATHIERRIYLITRPENTNTDNQ